LARCSEVRLYFCALPLLALLLTLLTPGWAFCQTAASPNATIVADARTFPGLDPSGATDSTSALQGALTAAAGKSLTLPPGTYSVTSLALPERGIRILGSGAKLVLGPNSSDGNPMLRVPAHASNIEIDGLEIDGRANVIAQLPRLREGFDTSSAASALHLARISAIASAGDTSGVVIKNMYLHDIPNNAIELVGGDTNWEVSGNRINGIGRHGIVIDNNKTPARNINIHDNRIDYCNLSPITIIAANGETGPPSAGAIDVKISKNYVSHNGLDINGYSPSNQNITVSENTIENNGIINKMGHAIHFAGTNIRIVGNIARNTAISGIVISGWPNANPTPVNGFEVSNNVIENILSSKNAKGILIQNASSGRIVGNRISGTRECPIEVDGNALGHGGPVIHRVDVIGNSISNSPRMGNIADQPGICTSQAEEIVVNGNRFSP
jgi:parallel beta-helix repeat protein